MKFILSMDELTTAGMTGVAISHVVHVVDDHDDDRIDDDGDDGDGASPGGSS